MSIYRRLHASLIALAVIGAVLSLSSPTQLTSARAHGSLGPGEETDLRAMAAHADLIVLAEIVDVQYKNVAIKGEQQTIPNGLVTLKISKTLRGKPSKGLLTLRFLGGPDGRGGILGVNGVPMFSAGETNLLFITDNGNSICPLVNCEWGRFRMHKGAVFNTHGSPVLSIVDGHSVARGLPPEELTLLRFPAPSFDAVMENPVIKERFAQMGMSYDEAKARYEREAPKFIEYRTQVPVIPEAGDPADDTIPPELLKEAREQMQGEAFQAPQTTPRIDLRKGPLKTTGPATPMTDKAFLTEVAKIASSVNQPTGQILSIDPAAEFVLPAITPAGPGENKSTPAVANPGAEREANDPLDPEGKSPTVKRKPVVTQPPVKSPLKQND